MLLLQSLSPQLSLNWTLGRRAANFIFVFDFWDNMVLYKCHMYELLGAKESFLGTGGPTEVLLHVAIINNWLNQDILYLLRSPYGNLGERNVEKLAT